MSYKFGIGIIFLYYEEDIFYEAETRFYVYIIRFQTNPEICFFGPSSGLLQIGCTLCALLLIFPVLNIISCSLFF
jgi:hypothetical protein